MVLLTDFLGFEDEAQSILGASLHHLDLLAVQIVDPIDRQLPPAGRYSVVDRRTPDASPVTISTRTPTLIHRHRQRFVERERELATFFARGRHLLTRVQTDDALLDAAARVLRRQATPAMAGLT